MDRDPKGHSRLKRKGIEWGTQLPRGLQHGALDAVPKWGQSGLQNGDCTPHFLWCAIFRVSNDSKGAQNR